MAALSIRKTEGDFENVLVRDVPTRVAAHVQIDRGAAGRRVVVAFPAGKSALAFETAEPAAWRLEGELRPFAEADGQRGVEFVLEADRPEIAVPVASVLLHHTLMARFGIDPDRRNENRLKDLFASGQIREIESALDLPLADLADRGHVRGPLADASSGSFAFVRRALDDRHRYRLSFAAGPGTTLRADGDRLVFSRAPASSAPLRAVIRASVDFEPLTPLPFAELVNDRGRELAARDPAFAEALRNFEFLAYREKFLAGSWNFLSFFGRDTLIALRIMWPVLSPLAKRVGIHSVANEISEEGIVDVTDEWTNDRAAMDALERFFWQYDRGDRAAARATMQAILAGAAPAHPFFDVLDPTYMYPSSAARWFRETDDAELAAWLRADHAVLGRVETNLASLLRNWNYLLAAATPFAAGWRALRARHPGLAPGRIVAERRDEFRALRGALVPSVADAANWRDTYHLPIGVRSEDVNVNLLPLALAAIRDMLARIAALGLGEALRDLAQQPNLNAVRAYLEDPGRFAVLLEAWDRGLVRKLFLVRRTADEIRADLARYLDGLAAGDATWGDRARGARERAAILRCQADGVSVAEFLRGERMPAAVAGGFDFTALFLFPDGTPMPIPHSDDMFLLLFGDPDIAQVREILRPLRLPYPFGLGFWDDDGAFAVSSGVYAPRDVPALGDGWKNAWVKFGPDEYHGRAAWPWVLFALLDGLREQALKNIAPDGALRHGMTPADVALFRRTLEQARIALPKLGPLATSEVFKYAPADSDAGVWQPVPMGISTPIQLWSAAPASLIIDDALARLALAKTAP